MSGTDEVVKFDRTTAAGRLAEMQYLDSLTEEELATTDPGHQYVTSDREETAEQRALLLQRLAEGETHRDEFETGGSNNANAAWTTEIEERVQRTLAGLATAQAWDSVRHDLSNELAE